MHCRIALNQITVCAKLRVRNLRRSGLFEEGDELLDELTRSWEGNVVTVGVPYMGKAYAAEPSHSGDQPYFRYARTDRRGGRWLPEPGCDLVTVREGRVSVCKFGDFVRSLRPGVQGRKQVWELIVHYGLQKQRCSWRDHVEKLA